MKYSLLHQFNPRNDLLSESKLKEISYDVGALKKILISKKMQHISTLNPDKKSIFYNYVANSSERNIQNTLIFLPDCSDEIWAQLKKLNFSNKKNYYFIDCYEGLRKNEIIELFKKKSVIPLNFINYFRKSNFYDWELSLMYSEKLNLENIVLNIFLSLGAYVRSHKTINQKMIFLKRIPLSFQHSIDLYKLV